MPHTTLAYRGAAAIARALLPVYARFDPKVRAAIAGREGIVERYRRWSREQRRPERPLLWMHAPSVGEGLQAEAVLQRLRAAHPDWQIAYTYFSPSAESLAPRQPADFADVLPWDRPDDVEAALDALAPRALVFSKLDLWPELVTRAAARGVRVGIVAATVSPGSGRLRWPARAALRPAYRAVSLAGAISEADGARLARLGVPRDHIEITGDPRYDSALARAESGMPTGELASAANGAATLVAGSTWAADERVLFAAFRAVRTEHPEARLIVVPHEPTPGHLAELERRAAAAHLPPPAYLSAGPGSVPFLVVDRVGMLASLYRGALVAYVGGGFGDAGLHSVLEPAAAGVPVLFGPRWQNSREAGLLLGQRAAIVVAPDFPDWLDLDAMSTHAGANPLAALWLALLRNPEHARAAGRRALECVEAGTGAAARSAGLVERLMAPPVTAP